MYFIRPLSENEGWSVVAVRDDLNSFVNRKDLPSIWGGKKDGEFAKISGVSDAIFCHKNLFLAVTNSKEGAIKLAELAVMA